MRLNLVICTALVLSACGPVDHDDYVLPGDSAKGDLASSDPFDLGGVTLPSGQTNVEIARIEVDPAGALSLGEIQISMESEVAAEDNAGAMPEPQQEVETVDPAHSYESVEVEQ